jgi:AraC family transcriptional regulator of adaptative response / DNA-3-methyladenine glycosylase II
MKIDQDICYRALSSRDRRFDGRFFTGVTSTGVYCRPVCPARTPKRQNCSFFPSAAAAEEAGFRPCLRCRPETSPGTPAWLGSSATVSRALRLIAEGALDRGGVEELAARLGVGGRHLRRLFDRELGASPLAVAQTRRVHFAKRLLDETRLPMTQIALAAGFANVRRFNAAVKKSYGCSPTEIRQRSGHQKKKAGRDRVPQSEGGSIILRLAYRPPYDWPALVAYLTPRATPGVEVVSLAGYKRTVCLGGARGVIEVQPNGAATATPTSAGLLLRVPFSFSSVLMPVVQRCRDLFDLGSDPGEIKKQLAVDPHMARLLEIRPGLRVPGSWDRFELAVRAILGQQVSVQGATTLTGRLVRAFGEHLENQIDEPGGAEGWPEGQTNGLVANPTWLFPTPESLAEADIAAIGLPRKRDEAVRQLARAVSEGTLTLDAAVGLADAEERLTSIPGVGRWTAQYIAMRALREPDAFPSGDLGLRRAFSQGSQPVTPAALANYAEAWRPWRAYAAMHLWMSETSAESSYRKKEKEGVR